MQKYIGTKLIKAEPMNRLDYNRLRGWALPEDENGQDDGYMVEYLDGGQPNVAGYEGYISWSPKAVFEQHYRIFQGPNQALTYSDALSLAFYGMRIARRGWNGNGMFVFLVREWAFSIEPPFDRCERAPFLAIKNAQNTVIPWVASQADQLSNDWRIVSFSD